MRFDSLEEGLSPNLVEKVEVLLKEEAILKRKSIYAKLITLHTHPKKEMLLPYIEDSQLSTVCINLLLGHEKSNPDFFRPRGLSSGGKTKINHSASKSSGSFHHVSSEPPDLSV